MAFHKILPTIPTSFQVIGNKLVKQSHQNHHRAREATRLTVDSEESREAVMAGIRRIVPREGRRCRRLARKDCRRPTRRRLPSPWRRVTTWEDDRAEKRTSSTLYMRALAPASCLKGCNKRRWLRKKCCASCCLITALQQDRFEKLCGD